MSDNAVITNHNAHIEQSYSIMARAVTTYKPSHIIACYSGGYDSMVLTHLAARWAKWGAHSSNFHVFAVDTLVSADGWRDYVTKSAKQLGAKHFAIWDNPNLDDWRNDVMGHGFAHTKKQHKVYFWWLKQRSFDAMKRELKKHRHDKILFLNGVRRAESTDRANAAEVTVKGSGVFCNPIVYWSDEQVHEYRVTHDLPINPFYDTLGGSGDCLCNWHNHLSLTELRQYSPNTAKIVEPLNAYTIAKYGYGYQGHPSRAPLQELAGQMRLFNWDTDCTPDLCAGCSKPAPKNDALDFVAMQRMDWGDEGESD